LAKSKALGHDIIVIGASAGGVPALTEICRALPRDLEAAVFVVVHTSPTSPGVLPQILDRSGPLSCSFPFDGQSIEMGRVYVAPPDHHMLLSDAIHLTRGPKENGFRPAVDPLFRTAARAFGSRVVGVVLSGGLDDGTEGLLFIKQVGGIAVVQDPAEAAFPSMPASAIEAVEVDHVVTVKQMPVLLERLTHERAAQGAVVMAKDLPDEPEAAAVGDKGLKNKTMPGPPTPMTCPECGGSLWEISQGQRVTRFRCHVGHSYTPKGLLVTKSAEVESALWSALRTLEENAELRRRMAERAAEGKLNGVAQQYQRAAADAEERATVIRQVLMSEREGNGEDTNGHSLRDERAGKSAVTKAKLAGRRRRK
jgi:two-component system, chemotaxis family, protein-glutamate methylesterase/glutaminase